MSVVLLQLIDIVIHCVLANKINVDVLSDHESESEPNSLLLYLNASITIAFVKKSPSPEEPTKMRQKATMTVQCRPAPVTWHQQWIASHLLSLSAVYRP